MTASRSLLASVIGGVVGGGLVAAAIFAAMAVSGSLDSSTKTLTVQETTIVPTSPMRALTAHEIYVRAAPGVVFVSASGVSVPQSRVELLRGEGVQHGSATGSGFEIGDRGKLLTNWHVVDGAAKVTVTIDQGRTVNATVIGKDPSSDLAVLRIATNGLTLHPLTLGDSSKTQVGQPVDAIGNPFGLAQTLTTGVISALQREITSPDGVTIKNALQTDAPINPGNSGGPLLNERGEVIGINSQIETGVTGGGNVGIAFAIPIDIAKTELPMLEKGGR